MNYRFLIIKLKNILLNPEGCLINDDPEKYPLKLVKYSLMVPLISLVSVSAMTGSLIFSNSESAFIYSLFTGIKVFSLFFITIYAAAYMLGEITYPLDLGKDFSKSFRIIVYSSLPFLLCQTLSRLFESLLFVNILGLYGLYIFWHGANNLLNPPQHKKAPLLIAITVTMAAIYIITNLALDMITDRIYFAFFA